jgi:hypothetical protein
MKRIFFALAALALFLPATAQVSKAADVSVNFFYDNLSGGDWIEVGDYGYVWQPSVAASNTSWRPYSDGYWAYTDLGWTWVSYEDFGWATYHYGRWARLSDYGWCWVPGRDEDMEWGPAWVSWRTGGDYIGWAPLPPRRGGGIYAGVSIGGRVDIDFDIGPSYYNFVDVRYIGEPVLRERIVDVNQNVTYINQTTNVTNITYKNKTVYNYGPDINVLNARASRPIQRLKIERQDNADINAAVKSGALLKPQGDKLVIAAPQHIRKADRQIAPPKIKTKVAKANIDTGWSGVSDPNVKTQMQQKMKTEDAKGGQINAAASTQATTGASPAASASASVSAAAGASPAQVEKGKGKRKNRMEENAAAGAAAGASPAEGASPATAATGASPADTGQGKKGPKRDRKGNAADLSATGAASPAEATSPAAAGAATGADVNAREGRGGGKHGRKALEGASPAQPEGQTNELSGDQGQGRGKHGGRRLEQPATGAEAPAGQAAGASDLEGQKGGGKHRGERAGAQPGGAPPGAVEGQGQGQGKRGKKEKAAEEAASPAAATSPSPY